MRRSLLAAAVVALGAVLSGCGSAAANPQQVPVSTVPVSTVPVTTVPVTTVPVTTVPVTTVPVTTVPVNVAPGVAISDDELAELERDISDIDAIISQASAEIAQG